VFTALFAVEYAARLYAVAERRPEHPWRERLRFMVSPLALIDLAALLALFLATGGSASLLRLRDCCAWRALPSWGGCRGRRL
jgi:voltage-gated potassium channel